MIRISYAGRIFSMGGAQPILHLFGATGGGNWRRTVVEAADIGPFQADWTAASVTIDTNWTDAEAIAHGWSPSSGASPWADVLEDVDVHHPFYGFSAGNAKAGLDNFRISSVPLPAAAWLLAPAVVGLLRIPLASRRSTPVV